MTISELASVLEVPVQEVFDHYEKIFVQIPQDKDFILSTELIRKALPHYQPSQTLEQDLTVKKDQQQFVVNQFDDLELGYEERKRDQKTILDQLNSYFNKSERSLLKGFKLYNDIGNFVFEGDYFKIPNKNFGYFRNITTQDEKHLLYPVSNERVDKIFIATGSLINGRRYSFQATLAKKFEREKHANPFLLQSINDNVEEIIKITELKEELKAKQEKLKEVHSYLETAEEQFNAKKDEIAEKVLNELTKRQDEADKIIESYNLTIRDKFDEIKLKEKTLSVLNGSLQVTNAQLKNMENLLSTLKDRVSLCRNLQFISEDDENKYLNLLSAKKFRPLNHHDFEKDFEKNFSKLSEHIHAYLFHKKNLIYTRYQIKNFLTLLKTHDIIVLSGLSGSGKTQIVKAFAEALGGVAKIIPVKPNWTSSDDLIGYYNPLQMSFLPTPFTEAIVEAINNPNQLYFICLDEMNLARAEYYFADFLSKLEERSKQPEIELYANHEEELFVSEFTTLLNLIESSINGMKIKSWQEFLNNEEARKKFFEMLGSTDKESMLQLHAKMKRRLIDILKFPSTIRIPDNIRFIGAINVDETTHYFSPKILDRIHVVKFENPLLFEEEVNSWFENTENEKELKPVYVQPNLLSERKEFPTVNNTELSSITQKLKEINQKFLLPLNIDFGIRSIRQSLNYAKQNKSTYDSDYDVESISLNTVILQKIFPRFIFDGSEISKNEKSKMEVVKELQLFLSSEFSNFYFGPESDYSETDIGKSSSEYLGEMINQANRNNSQFNFFA